MSYLDFLKKLLALGPKLPEAFDRLQRIIGELQGLIAFLTDTEPLFGEVVMEPNATEQAAEGEVLAAMAGSEETFGAFDGKLLRQMFEFIRANPQLMQLILSLLK